MSKTNIDAIQRNADWAKQTQDLIVVDGDADVASAPKRLPTFRVKYDEEEARDEQGRWTDGGDSGTSKADEYARSLPEDQKMAVLDYASSEYHGINAYLRGGGGKDGGWAAAQEIMKESGYLSNPDQLAAAMKDEVEKIDAAFKEAPKLDPGTELYRGLVLPEGFTPEVGATFTDKAYVSTSADASKAQDYADWKVDAGHAPSEIAVATITADGSRAIPVESVWKAHDESTTSMQSEREVLLNRGSTFVVTAVSGGGTEPYQLSLQVKGRR